MLILAFDPSLTCTGWAALLVDGESHKNLNNAVRGLQSYGEITTDSGETMPERLAGIDREVRLLIREKMPAYVLIEMPSYQGDYKQGLKRIRSVAKLYQAIGTIQAAAMSELWSTGGQVVRIPAMRQPKEVRHEILKAAFDKVGLPWPEGPRGGERQDAVDAIWVGVQWIMEQGQNKARTG